MKITVYELLGLMLKRQAPKKIEVLGFTMNYVKNAHWGDYEDETTGARLSNFRLNECLNDTVEILEEQKKIPEKLPYYSLEKIQKAKNKDEWREERISLLEKRGEDLHIKINEIIDYLESKGE